MITKKTSSIYYLDNKMFTEALVQFRKEKEADPTITFNTFSQSDYLGRGIIQICKGLASKKNFSGYTFRDEFISDAIENCLRAAANFDPSISSNAFGYFTMVASRAFIRRIQKEQKKRNQHLKMLSDSVVMNELVQSQFDGEDDSPDGQAFINQIQNYLSETERLQEMMTFKVPEEAKRKLSKKTSPLDEYIEIS
jgi:hypothetical protein